jgi:hypothetical protein
LLLLGSGKVSLRKDLEGNIVVVAKLEGIVGAIRGDRFGDFERIRVSNRRLLVDNRRV